jgi:hypothetical protein
MNWRRGLLRLWLVLSLCWVAAVGVYAWKQEPWISSPQFVYETASSYRGNEQSNSIGLNIGAWRVTIDRQFEQLSPEKQNETAQKIANSLNAELAKRYVAYVLVPPLATLVLGFLGAWVVSGFERRGA